MNGELIEGGKMTIHIDRNRERTKSAKGSYGQAARQRAAREGAETACMLEGPSDSKTGKRPVMLATSNCD